MIKVFVAEDQLLILKSIVKLIEDYHGDLKVVGQACDGLTAQELIQDLKPDIVITDIKMPVMDGLELIGKVKEFIPNSVFIIVSGFSDFSFAQQAIEMGVNDYILKPVTRDKLYKVLENMIEIVDRNMNQQEDALLQNILFSKQKMQQAHKFHHSNFMPVTFNFGCFSSSFIEYTTFIGEPLFIKEFLDHVKCELSELGSVFIYDHYFTSEYICIIASNDKVEPSRVTEKLDKIKLSESQYTTIIGSCLTNPIDLPVDVQINRAILKKSIRFGRSLTVVRDDNKRFAPDVRQKLDKIFIERIVSEIRGNRIADFFKEIDSLIQSWEGHEITQLDLHDQLTELLKIIAEASFLPAEMLDNPDEIERILVLSGTYENLKQELNIIFDDIFYKYLSMDRIDFSKNATIIIEHYIKKHYASPITVTDLAKIVSLSPAYLSRIFKKHLGKSPMQYIMDLRMGKAKETILSNPNISIKEVAELVGYTNPLYFSKIFKEAFGVAPSYYYHQTG